MRRAAASPRHVGAPLGVAALAVLLAVMVGPPAAPPVPGALAALATLGPAPAHAQPVTADDGRELLERLADRAAERIEKLRAEAATLATRERTLLGELRALEVERQLKREELAGLEREVAEAEAGLATTTAEIADLEATAVEQRPGVEARLVELYKLGRPRYTRLLLGVDDLRAIGRAYRMIAALAELDRQRIATHRDTLTALRASREALETRHAELAGLVADAQAARGELDRAVRAHAARIDVIDERRDLTAQLTGELQLAHQQLQASLTALATGSGLGLTTAPLALPLRPFRGELPRPVEGPVSAPFGREQQTRFGTAIQRNGIEITAPEGTPVLPIHEGQVAFADTFTGFGNLVILDHGAQSYSLYGYLDTLGVDRGLRVDRATPLGTVGRGPTGENRLYFELRIDGQPVDPVEWLGDR